MTTPELQRLFWAIKAVYDTEIMDVMDKKVLEKTLTILHKLSTRSYAKGEARYFQLCKVCKTEIDLRKKDSLADSNGFFLHRTCPTLKPEEDRNF